MSTARWEPAWGPACDDGEGGQILMATHVDLKGLTIAEKGLVKDGLAALLAALPARHTARIQVTGLIDRLKESE